MTDEEQAGISGHSERERERAERQYVAALVALDAAAEPSPTVAGSAASAATDVMRLNEIWQHHDAAGSGGRAGLLARILTELGRLMPWRRRRLFGAMIAATNRNADTTRALIDATQHFQSHVIWYAQTVASLAASPRRGAAGAAGAEQLEAAINALSTNWLTHWESLAARDQRYEARMESLTKAYQDLKDVAAMAQQSTLSIKRTVDAWAGDLAPGSVSAATAPAGAKPAAGDTDAFKYVGFEDRFRGPRAEVRERLLPYLPLFAGATNVLDVGCGRGELLELFREHGVGASGVDGNEEMVEACRARGLTAEQGDALATLAAKPDHSLGGLTSIQMVEHLEPAYLMRFLETAHHKLRDGATMVLETINPACWAAFFDSYIRDLTHVRPLHPDTLQYLVQASGFSQVDVRYLSPVAEDDKLPSVAGVAPDAHPDPAVNDLIEAVNTHALRLNSRLFTFRDYAIIARK